MIRKLLLLIVSYHTPEIEVDILLKCLSSLPSNIGYALAVNEYRKGQVVEKLFANSDHLCLNSHNLGYGRAINLLISKVHNKPQYIAILNTDLQWSQGTFQNMMNWMDIHYEISLIVPKIVRPSGQLEMLCKRNPTVLALMSRRFIPDKLKPLFLKKYDTWYCFGDYDYNQIFEAPYLSGCCMFTRLSSFIEVGGFDERYFLYLEDADLTRSLSKLGKCIHYPHASVVHQWGRGNYTNMYLALINIISAFHYFWKWGLEIW
tara:strand:+ start:452 stop:1234 length:783 start_codon:yes stop_codon:yes gene_type:complete